MNVFEKILYDLNNLRMETPTSFGWLHLLWLGLIILTIVLTIVRRKKFNEKKLNTVLLIYGIGSLILELIKQIMWAFNYDNGVVSYSYSWYSAPFQLCTTPMFVALIIPFTKGKFKDSLLSYLAFYTILSSFMVMMIPSTCFTSQILINIHTMYLHAFAFSVSLYILINKAVKINKENLFNAFKVFIFFVIIALLLDIGIYNSGILNGETFNMFYISPYFPCTLPVFGVIKDSVPYIIFLLSYISIISLGSIIVYLIVKFINKKNSK